MRRTLSAVALLLLALSATAANTSPPLPLWELGAVGTGASVADYPGADRNQVRVLALPYAIYRGKTLRADDAGLRGRYRFTPDAELDLSFGGALPVGRGNAARQGMPQLDLLLEVGPRLTLVFARPSADAAWSLAVPVRAVFSTDFTSIGSRGLITTPELVYTDRKLAGSAWRTRLAAGPVFASQGLMDYFYTVAPTFARADRPAYQAQGGYLQSRLTASASRAFNDALTLFTFAQASSLHGASNTHSPLLRDDFNWALGFGIAYTLRRSTQIVASED